MKFETLNLEKYGAFENRELVFRAGARLHLVLGANETGKSTALNAIYDLLFGFESKTLFDFRFPAPQLRAGARLRLRDGSQIEFLRRKGQKKTVLDAKGVELGDDLLAPVLAGVDRAMFQRDFGLDAQALREGGQAILHAKGNLAETLAAGSGGLLALNRLKARLQDDADDVFTPRRSANKPFYLAHTAYTEAGDSLKAAIVTSDALKQAQQRAQAAVIARADALEDSRTIARALSRLQRARRTRSKLAELDKALAQHAALAALPIVDAAALDAWVAARDQLAGVSKEIASTAQALADNAAARGQLQLQPQWLAQAGEIDKLRGALAVAHDRMGDLPKREEARRAARAALEDAANRLGLASMDVLVEHMPDDIAMARVRSVLRARETLDGKLQASADRRARAQRDFEAQEQSARGGAEHATVNPAPLLQAFEAFAVMPANAARLREREAEHAEAMRALEQDVARLHPSAGDLDSLLARAIPGETLIEDAIRQWSDLTQARQSLDRDKAGHEQFLRKLKAQIADLAREGEVATLEDLRKARALRDTAVDALEAIDDPSARAALLAHVRQSVSAADHVADVLLNGASRAARKQALDGELAQAQVAAQDLQTRESEHALRATQARDSWRQAWAQSGVAPAQPVAMREWRKDALALVERHGKLAAGRAVIVSTRQQLSDMSPALQAFVSGAGAALGHVWQASMPPDMQHAAVATALARLRELWDASRTAAMALENARARLGEARQDCAALDDESTGFAPQWHDAMSVLCIHADATHDEAAAALEIWRSAITHRRDFVAADERATTLTRLIAEFESSLVDACSRFGSEHAGEAPQQMLEALAQNVQGAREAAATAKHLEQATAQIEHGLQGLQTRHSALAAQLAQARGILALPVSDEPDDAALRTALDQLVQRRDLETLVKSLRDDLAASGDDLGVDELRAQQQGLDFDTLADEIARLEGEAERLRAASDSAAIAESEARKALEALGAGRDAAGASARRAQAGGELADIANAWLARAAAARLAGLAIERHRQSAQDPVLAAISRLFAAATGGAYAGIAVDFDERDQPEFRALRPGGERVGVPGLSEGTRDQLFLALRLALLERRPGEPLPFIADDILASFDDARTAHALDLLAGNGEKPGEANTRQGRQIILFTHHAHVAEIARARLGEGLDLIDLAG